MNRHAKHYRENNEQACQNHRLNNEIPAKPIPTTIKQQGKAMKKVTQQTKLVKTTTKQ